MTLYQTELRSLPVRLEQTKKKPAGLQAPFLRHEIPSEVRLALSIQAANGIPLSISIVILIVLLIVGPSLLGDHDYE